MDLGPYEGIPGVTAPFVRVSSGTSGYYLDVDVGVAPTSSKVPDIPSTPIPRASAPAPPAHAVFTRGVRHHQSTLEPFTYTALNTIHEEMGVVMKEKKKVARQRSASVEARSEVTSTDSEVPSTTPRSSKRRDFYRQFDDKPVQRSRSLEDDRPRGRLLPAPHVNPNRDLPRDPTAPKPPPFPAKLATFTKDKIIPASKSFATEKVIPAARQGATATKTFTKEKVIPGVKTGAERTIYQTRKGAKIAQYKTSKGAKLTKKRTVQFIETTKPKVKDGVKNTGKKVKIFIRNLKMKCRPREATREYPWLDYRDYCMSSVEEEEPEEILESEEEDDYTEEVIDLQIPEFQARPGQMSRDFKSPYLDQAMRKGDAIPSPLRVTVKDDLNLSSSKSPPVSGLTSPVSILSSPASAHREVLVSDVMTSALKPRQQNSITEALHPPVHFIQLINRVCSLKNVQSSHALASLTPILPSECRSLSEIVLLDQLGGALTRLHVLLSMLPLSATDLHCITIARTDKIRRNSIGRAPVPHSYRIAVPHCYRRQPSFNEAQLALMIKKI